MSVQHDRSSRHDRRRNGPDVSRASLSGTISADSGRRPPSNLSTKGDPIVPVMPAARAQQLCETVFQRLNLSDSEVADCTRAIMFATVRGLDSHGIVSILPGVAFSVKRGQTQPHAEIITLSETPITAAY